MFLYALTILVSAFLLFQVQPVIAKIILPWFGGLGGGLDHLPAVLPDGAAARVPLRPRVIRYLRPRAQMLLHCGLLLVSAAAPADLSQRLLEAHGRRGSHPGRFCGLLAVTVGLPYFLLSTTGPLLAGLVRAPLQGLHAVPPVRAFECRVHVRADQLSVPVRAGLYHARAGRHVVDRLRRIHRAVRLHGLSVGRTPVVEHVATADEAPARSPACASTPCGWPCRPAPRCCCWPSPITFRRTWPPSRSCGCCRSAFIC